MFGQEQSGSAGQGVGAGRRWKFGLWFGNTDRYVEPQSAPCFGAGRGGGPASSHFGPSSTRSFLLATHRRIPTTKAERCRADGKIDVDEFRGKRHEQDKTRDRNPHPATA